MRLTAVTGCGSNPGALKMYIYSPAGVGPDAPLVVAMHGCTQGAQDYVKAGWNQLADTWKFHVVHPEQQTANSSFRCFNWYEPGDTKRDQGEALSIKQMVDWAAFNSYVCTLGSNENIGLYNLQYTWVKKTAPGYHQAGKCP